MVSRGGGGECVASCGELVSDRSSHFGDSVLKMSPSKLDYLFLCTPTKVLCLFLVISGHKTPCLRRHSFSASNPQTRNITT